MTIQDGKQAPDFTLPASNGEQVSLSDYRGQYVLLYFYPRDMTPGCTQQACDIRDRHAEFSRLNTVVLGISTDPLQRHEKFVAKYGLPYLLLADVDHHVAQLYEVWKPKRMFGREFLGTVRSTFVVGKDGTLLHCWRKVRVDGHIDEALHWIEEHERLHS